MPLVSVIVPTYNRAKMLEEAVKSVLTQFFKDFELIVVDDGSGDKTGQVMEKYTGMVKYVPKENGGVASARNLGLKTATGELVAWLDDDDLFLPGKLALQVEFFRSNPRAGLVYTGHVLMNMVREPKRQTFYLPRAYRNCKSTREALLREVV